MDCRCIVFFPHMYVGCPSPFSTCWHLNFPIPQSGASESVNPKTRGDIWCKNWQAGLFCWVYWQPDLRSFEAFRCSFNLYGWPEHISCMCLSSQSVKQSKGVKMLFQAAQLHKSIIIRMHLLFNNNTAPVYWSVFISAFSASISWHLSVVLIRAISTSLLADALPATRSQTLSIFILHGYYVSAMQVKINLNSLKSFRFSWSALQVMLWTWTIKSLEPQLNT